MSILNGQYDFNNPMFSMGSSNVSTSMFPPVVGGNVPKLKTTDTDWMSKFNDNLGGIGDLLGGIGSVAGAYNGYKQLGLAKDAFAHQKQYAAANLANQAQTTNQQLESNQRARLASRGIHGDSVGNSPELQAYMAQNSVKGKV